MPTGYTAKLLEENQTFEEFVWTCARAFGAMIEMRDEPLDAPIPDKFESDNYHDKAMRDATAELTRLQGLTEAQKIAEGEAKKRDRIKYLRESIERDRNENKRMQAMIQRVNKWEPPTAEHAGIKKFMLEQLTISLNNTDYYDESLKSAITKSPLALMDEEIERRARDIAYHSEHRIKDRQRLKERNDWLRQLRESVPLPDSKRLVSV